MSKATNAKAIVLSTLLGLGAKSVKAQEECQPAMSKQVVAEKTVTHSVPNNKGKIVQFSDAKNWLNIEPQFSCYLDAPHGAKFVGTSMFALKPSVDFFNRKVSAGVTSTCWLSNYDTETIAPKIFDFYGHADVKLGKNKSIEVKYGNFSAVNYGDDASWCMPSRVEYLDRNNLKSGFYFPMAAMVGFHDTRYSAGVGLSSSTPHKWQGDRNVFVAGEYDVFGNKYGDFKAKVGCVLSYNIGTFGGENQIGKEFKDRISGTVQFVAGGPGGCSLVEVTGFGAQKELSVHFLQYCDIDVLVPNCALSFDLVMQDNFNEDVYGLFVKSSLDYVFTLWYNANMFRAFVSVGVTDEKDNTNVIWQTKHPSVEMGAKASVGKMIREASKHAR